MTKAYVERLLDGIRTAQHSAQPDLDLVDRLSVSVLEDILDVKRMTTDARIRAVLDFIHFDLSILPLGLAAGRKRLELMFLWIARSLVEQIEIGMAVDIDPITFAARINPARSPVAKYHGHLAALEWLTFLYYTRVTGGHRLLAEALEHAAVKLATEAGFGKSLGALRRFWWSGSGILNG